MYASQSPLPTAPPRAETHRRLALAARVALVLTAVAALLFVPDARAHRRPGSQHTHRTAAMRRAATLPDPAPGATRTYAAWSTLTQETVDGRVWEGVHFRFSDETAVRVGEAVARHDLRRLRRLGL